MQKIANHIFLVHGDSFTMCQEHLTNFLQATSLVQYDHQEIISSQAIQATNNHFLLELNKAVNQNHQTVQKLIQEVQQTGLSDISELANLKQGYPSKVLHILAHFLDGFIGIDSKFYNLPDDSHWIDEKRAKEIAETPAEYWLIPLDGYSYSPAEAALLHM